MNKRLLSITVVGWLFIATGCVSLVRGMLPLVRSGASGRTSEMKAKLADSGLVCGSGFFAAVGGAFLLLGRAWARWMCLAWMGLHVILSIFHPVFELIVHGLLFAALTFLLFRPRASAYFRIAAAQTV